LTTVRKRIVGYTDKLTVRPGETIEFKVSSPVGGSYRAQLVRLIDGDSHSARSGFSEHEVEADVNGVYRGRPQDVDLGSCVIAETADSWLAGSFTLAVTFMPTLLAPGRQHLVSRGGATGWSLLLDDGRLAFARRDGGTERLVHLDVAPEKDAWHRAAVRLDTTTGHVTLDALRLARPPWIPAGDRMTASGTLTVAGVGSGDPVLLGAMSVGRSASGARRPREGFSGRLESPVIYGGVLTDAELERVWTGERPPELAPRLTADWDFADGIDRTTVTDRSPHGQHGRTRNLPLRGVRGSSWSGTEFRWRDAPAEYAAIAFHGDDLADCGWETDARLTIPAHLPSGVYALRLRLGDNAGNSVTDPDEDYLPFFVAAPRDRPGADIAFLAPTNTYLAYGNMRSGYDDFVASGRAPDDYFASNWLGPGIADYMLALGEHPEFGMSVYDRHADGTPMHTSTWHRPLLNLRPKSVLWTFCADLLILGWLESQGQTVDVITDDLLDREGEAVLEPYRVVITGNHPEYVTTRARDAIEYYLGHGGRLMYLGGNGFYWRCATHPELPGAIEVRRGRVGTGVWTSEVGEGDLAFTGEVGGLWREIGRPPQQLLGVGFIAEGPPKGAYRIQPGARQGRAAFALEGIDDEVFGETGIFGSAVGQEIDRSDPGRGTPAHAVVIARSEGHDPGMLFAIEEMVPTVPVLERYRDETYSEVVFFETLGGGAVFAAGSMAWCGALGGGESSTDVSRITANVLRRMRDPRPFDEPPLERI
jgi:N,N-dimethylformamidase